MTMEEKEFNNTYAIPANYTDSGKIFGGMLEIRNTVETGILLMLLGYPELMLIPMSGTIRIVVMTVTLLPLSVLSLMGLDGDSLFQYLGHMVLYFARRRKLHFRRLGFPYEPKRQRKKGKDTKRKKKKAKD